MFKRFIWIISAMAVPAWVLAGCNSANSRVSPVSFGSSQGIVTSGNLRLVTERQKAHYPPVTCTEPSPDYMVAFGSTQKLAGTAPTSAGARSVEVNLTSSEVVSEGKGREAAVLALRDGLYVACQSYANGVIGQDAYSIILSQYGNLLVALVGNDKAADKVQVSGPPAAISAMTVACISGHDRSRDDHGGNKLLTESFCRNLLNRVAAGGGSGAAAGRVAKTTERPAATRPQTTVSQPASGSSVTTTTTTNTTVR